MALPPVTDLAPEIQSSDPAAFASRRPNQDAVILEPIEPGRDYVNDLHPMASYVFLPRAANQPVPVGRDARAVVLLDHAAVSRLHMVMAWTGDAWQFMDRSSNGVFVHGQRVAKEQPTAIAYGNPIRLGKALMLRVLTPEGLYGLVARTSAPAGAGAVDPSWGSPLTPQSPFQVGPGAPATPPSAPIPAPPLAFEALPPPPIPAPVTEEFELDFDFDDAPLDPDFVGDGYDSEATEAYLSPPSPPSAPTAPRAPTPPAPPPPVTPEDINFDFDFEAEGKGGFA